MQIMCRVSKELSSLQCIWTKHAMSAVVKVSNNTEAVFMKPTR